MIAEFYSPKRIESEIKPALPHWSDYIVVEDDQGKVVAAGGGAMSTATSAELYVLYADPDRRGKGFGSAVLQLLTSQQVAAGAREQSVSVQKGNELGIPFYRARGFEVVEEVTPWDKTLSGEGVLNLRMRRTIG